MCAILLFGMPGMWEWIIIAGLLVVVFGAKRIPAFIGGLGKGIKEFKNELKDPTKGIDDADKDTPELGGKQ